MRQFMGNREVRQGYVITQRWDDFGHIAVRSMDKAAPDQRVGEVVAIQAPLACYWLSGL